MDRAKVGLNCAQHLLPIATCIVFRDPKSVGAFTEDLMDYHHSFLEKTIASFDFVKYFFIRLLLFLGFAWTGFFCIAMICVQQEILSIIYEITTVATPILPL